MSNIEVRSKLTNPPKLRSKVSNISPSREGNCELNRNAFPPPNASLASPVNRQWARENCEIFPLVAEERERAARSLP